MKPSTTILSIPFHNQDISAAVSLVLHMLQQEDDRVTRCISATSAHGLVVAQKDPHFAATLQSFFLNLPDGQPIVWLGRLKGAKAMQRCYGPDFFAALMRATAHDRTICHYLCGGKPGVAIELQQVCARKFGNKQVVGAVSPPFRPLAEQEFRALGAEIDRAGASVVWIGMSTPKQERFAVELARCTNARFIITVGAAFDFHTGRVRQAPAWMQHAGLEWLFRLSVEPKRLYRRYIEVVPLFLIYATRELLNKQ
ncbi:WecB/TagA/CpsF family glycosyltransferase [uncultured Chloroflexus sp.]|uniref:WecB/TagA/CpsF family glycosyltransferase n=1 Tax=uncultured Chloroflexus sp. TaxID=214040 RepID=UPI002616624C|nr:WecB/TagA/CpsF family glycosyltransferase [uncultured Chloroflexus sp.]